MLRGKQCDFSDCVQLDVMDQQQWDPESLGLHQVYLKLVALFVPFIPEEHSRRFLIALYLLCTVGTFLVLYPKLHRY